MSGRIIKFKKLTRIALSYFFYKTCSGTALDETDISVIVAALAYLCRTSTEDLLTTGLEQNIGSFG